MAVNLEANTCELRRLRFSKLSLRRRDGSLAFEVTLRRTSLQKSPWEKLAIILNEPNWAPYDVSTSQLFDNTLIGSGRDGEFRQDAAAAELAWQARTHTIWYPYPLWYGHVEIA